MAKTSKHKKENVSPKGRLKPISLYPLNMEEAISGLLKTTPLAKMNLKKG